MSVSGPECLYYSDPDLDETEAILLESRSDGREIVLDRTIFFPEGGGQPWDGGHIEGISVESVVESEGRIVHRLALPIQRPVGSSLRLRLDRGRRRDHSEQHSAQHLLSGLLFRNFRIATLSFHLGSERSTIDIDTAEFPESLVEKIDDEVNESIAKATPFKLHRCPPEDIESLELRRPPPQGEAVFRVWEIEGLDCSPCCGTHIASAAELRLFKICLVERYKGRIRLHFVAGGRAVSDYRELHRAVSAAGRVLSATPETLAENADRLIRKSRDSTARADRCLSLLVESLLNAALPSDPVFLDLSGAGVEAIEEGMRALRAKGRSGVVSVPETSTVGLVGKSGQKLPSVISETAKALGGRGGGPSGSLRYAFPDSVSAAEFAANARQILLEG